MKRPERPDKILREFFDFMERELIKRFKNQNVPNVEEMVAFRKSIIFETDRGCALMSAACIDNFLGNLLRAHLIDDTTVVPKLFMQYGPLSTFSSRTDLAYVLGLIDAETRREINLVRKIRNEFAHRHEPISFELPAIKDQCRQFLLSQKVDTPRKQFTLGVMFTLATLITRIQATTHCQPRRDALLLRKGL